MVRKLIAFDDDTFEKLKQLARDRMATIQELAEEAFADVLKKHGIPIDLKAALRKSASLAKARPGVPASKPTKASDVPINENAKAPPPGKALQPRRKARK